MKKRILAIAFVILMFPMALILTACGGGGLKTDVQYCVDSATISWANDGEKEMFLGMTGMTEQELIAGSTASQKDMLVVFKEDGKVEVTYAAGVDPMIQYYVVSGNTITMYQDEAKENELGTLKIVGDTLVQESPIYDNFESKTKIVYKVKG